MRAKRNGDGEIQHVFIVLSGLSLFFGLVSLISILTPRNGPAPIDDYSLAAWLVFWRCLVICLLCAICAGLADIAEILRKKDSSPR